MNYNASRKSYSTKMITYFSDILFFIKFKNIRSISFFVTIESPLSFTMFQFIVFADSLKSLFSNALIIDVANISGSLVGTKKPFFPFYTQGLFPSISVMTGNAPQAIAS